MKSTMALAKIVEKTGSVSELARLIKANRTSVSMWVNGKRNIPAIFVKRLVSVSEGEVRKKDLRPDLYDD
jgi:DNA-binding transcriptional regulator YdaS (Cro superfamily)